MIIFYRLSFNVWYFGLHPGRAILNILPQKSVRKSFCLFYVHLSRAKVVAVHRGIGFAGKLLTA